MSQLYVVGPFSIVPEGDWFWCLGPGLYSGQVRLKAFPRWEYSHAMAWINRRAEEYGINVSYAHQMLVYEIKSAPQKETPEVPSFGRVGGVGSEVFGWEE